MRATAFMLGIVVAAVGCDKTPDEPVLPAVPALDLDATPDLVFHVFGQRSEPRMMPIAAIKGNSLVPIDLPPDGWRKLDTKYLSAGTAYPLYRDGHATGTVTVQRGMWAGEPLYSLPGCTNTIPMASVSVGDSAKGATIDQYATTRAAATRKRGPLMSLDSVRAIAKRMGYLVGKQAGLDSVALDELDFRGVAMETRKGARPTIMASFIEPRIGDGRSARGKTTDVLVFADDDGTGYKPSYSHAASGDATKMEFRSYVDHLDVTGDSIDEILLDGWHIGEQTSLRMLAWRNGTWREVFAGRSSWCVDPPKK